MQKCPHPNCSYTASYFVSSNHCSTEHQMTKKELFEQYGTPVDHKIDSARLKKNMDLYYGEWNDQLEDGNRNKQNSKWFVGKLK